MDKKDVHLHLISAAPPRQIQNTKHWLDSSSILWLTSQLELQQSWLRWRYQPCHNISQWLWKKSITHLICTHNMHLPNGHGPPTEHNHITWKPMALLPSLRRKRLKYNKSLEQSCTMHEQPVDPTMLVALNEISHEQSKPTHTKNKRKSHPTTRLCQYLSKCHHPILQEQHDPMDWQWCCIPSSGTPRLSQSKTHPITAQVLHIERTLLQQVVTAASKAELVAAFINAQKSGVPMEQALEDMGPLQPPTPLKMDNITAHGILTPLVKQKCSKAFDMCFYWLKNLIQQK